MSQITQKKSTEFYIAGGGVFYTTGCVIFLRSSFQIKLKLQFKEFQ
jgi:hypothetical protein